MNKMSYRILFFGNERLATGVSTAAPTLQALVAAGYEVAAVIVAQNDAGKSRQTRQLEIAAVAGQHNIPVLSPDKLSESQEELAGLEAGAAVLVAYGKIVPRSVIDIFPRGIVNIHPSLLPRHRGSAPIESVILDNEKETGVSLMRLSAKMDAGPVYVQQIVPLRGDETKQKLADQLLELGKNMLITHLPKILDSSLEPKAQDEAKATYDQQIKKSDSQLDFSQPASQLVRQIRAYDNWPRSRAMVGTTEVIITKAHVGETSGTLGTLLLDKKQLGIRCSEGTLIIDSLIPSGKKEMSAEAFLAGYHL